MPRHPAFVRVDINALDAALELNQDKNADQFLNDICNDLSEENKTAIALFMGDKKAILAFLRNQFFQDS